MAVNKVQRKNGDVILDVTGVTADAADVAAGKKFVGADGVLRDGSMPSVTQATPSISVSSVGLITASATQAAGKVAAGTKSATKQLTTQGAKTVTPTTSEQVAVEAGVYTTGEVKVAAVSYDERAALREQLLWLQSSDMYALYADVPNTVGGRYTLRQHVSSWVADSVYNNPTTYPTANYRDAVNVAFAALDDAVIAAASVTDTVVQGLTVVNGTTITISGLSFNKVKTVFVGPMSGSPNSMYIYGMLLHDGGGISFITYSGGSIYVKNGGNSVNGKYTYTNGTLTIDTYFTIAGSGSVYYTIIGE